MDEPIYVTQPDLPPLKDFIPYLEQIWASKILTNQGPYHNQLEQALCEYLNVGHVSLLANGTVALLVALKAMKVTGEVITTPYSFVATAHSLLWSNLTPVFVDIEPRTLNLDPNKIENAITPQTTAILPVHCYGNPCDFEAIRAVAGRYDLKVIYDAAHGFGVQCHCGSILAHGDLSVISFHATKVFNTFEGGAIICPDAETKHQLDRLRNFGFAGETRVDAVGINGKMNEMQAAIGLLQLQHIDSALACRAVIAARYREAIESIPGLTAVPVAGQRVANNAYFPILVGDVYPLTRDELYSKLKANGIYGRRYFYPLITEFPMYRDFPSAARENLPVANRLSSQVLCLPIYPSLSEEDQSRIIGLIQE